MIWIKKVIHSIFARLVLISLITWLCIILVSGIIFFISRLNAARPFHSNVVQYFEYIIQDLGSPPSLENARLIEAKTGMKISYDGSSSWSTILDMPPAQKIRYHRLRNFNNIAFGRFHGRHFLKMNHSSGSFIFEFTGYNKNKARTLWLHFIMLISLTLIIAGAYFAIKRILRPLKELQKGVEEVSQGNLNYRVPDMKKDEFGNLAQAFNTMTQQLNDILKSKELLLRDVSHELRSPLTRMKIALEFIQDQETRENLDADIIEMEKKISMILENLKLHHNHEHLNKQKADLTDLIQRQVALFRKQQPEILFNPVGPLYCQIDPDRIKMVVANILDNAVKYSQENSDPVEVKLISDKQWVSVTVTDSGIGISPDALSMILEPFYRVDQSRSKKSKGFGLGLNMCKTIMEAHKGQILIDSQPGKGTSVTLRFPNC